MTNKIFLTIMIFISCFFSQAEYLYQHKNLKIDISKENTKSIVSNGLILNLDATDHNSYSGTGNTWNDISTKGGAATLYGSPSFNSDNSFFFNGNYAQLSRSDLNAGSFAYPEITVELMIKPSSVGNPDVNKHNIITVESAFEISISRLSSSKSAITYATNPWIWTGNSNEALTNDKWNMITFINNSEGRFIYVNGINTYSNTSEKGPILAGSNEYPYLTLMGRFFGNESNAEGSLAQVRIYNRTLSLEEIEQNFQATKDNFGL